MRGASPYSCHRRKIIVLKKILIAVVAVVVVLVIVIATRPADFHVERSTNVSAPAPVAFDQVNDLHNWQAWSPWAKRDPAAKNSFEGPPAGEGAKFSWAGNSDVGEGSMTIVESRPNELVKFRIDFLKPFAASHTAQFDFKPSGDQTSVRWSMDGKCNFISKALCLFMSMDKMMGPDFEQGLASMKSIAEAKQAPPAATIPQ